MGFPKETERFTVIFLGNLREVEGNPFHKETPFGRPIAVARGDALQELARLEDETIRELNSKGLVAVPHEMVTVLPPPTKQERTCRTCSATLTDADTIPCGHADCPCTVFLTLARTRQ